MTTTISPAPVRKSVFVPATPEHAFEVFTRGMNRWWPRTHSIGSSPIAEAIIEPEVGGRWYERSEDGSECQWGEVLAWDPPSRLVLAWQINGQWAFDPNLITEVEIRFTPEDGGTRVDLEHRNLERFGEAAETVRAAFDGPDGWPLSLGLFAKAAS